MLAFPGMLSSAAAQANMACPDDPDGGNWKKEDFPHFYIFCALQLGRRMTSMGEHWENAKIIAAIPVEELKTMTLDDFLAKGLLFSS